jgi:hypothetical protein
MAVCYGAYKMTARFDLITGRDVTQNGATKTYWTRVGTMFPSKKEDDTYVIKLDAIPLPNKNGEVWIKASIPRDKNGGEYPQKNGQGRASLSDQLSDGIPF